MCDYSSLQRLAIAPHQWIKSPAHPVVIQLTSRQNHYLRRVLRLTDRDHFIALDGNQWWLAEIGSRGETTAWVHQQISIQTELPMEVILVSALPKGNGFDEVIRQATELGVGEIVPVLSERTLLQPSSSKLLRWQRIIEEAAEQSHRQRIPRLINPLSFDDYLVYPPIATPSSSLRLIGVCQGNAPLLLSTLNSMDPFPPAIIIAMGPEGGWTQPEFHKAIAHGYQPISLGQRTLRSVTAPVAAMAIMMAFIETHHHSWG